MNDSIRLLFATGVCAGSLVLFGGACHKTTELAPPPPPASDDVAAAMGALAAVDVGPLQDPPPTYDPCDDKVCGQICRLCPPGSEETCTEQIRHCDASGLCTEQPPTCSAVE